MYESGVARGETVKLGQLETALSDAGLLVSSARLSHDIEIDHLAVDSRVVGPRGLFIAICGERVDGRLFIDMAVENGAIAIVCEATPAEPHKRLPGVALVPVLDSRKAAGIIAATYFDTGSNPVRVVGVTGTNGKTTTAWLTYQALNELNPPSGLVGTIEYRTPLSRIPASHTTPDALNVHALLHDIDEEGGRSCVMEVSSHALVQGRVAGVQFNTAVFTNLTQDHLDYHNDMASYRDAKKILFDELDKEATAVYNLDDDYGASMVADTRAGLLSFGTRQDADIRFSVLENRLDGLSISIDGSVRHFDLVGRFNAYNLAAAYASTRSMGYGSAESLDALEAARAAPGRFETIALDNGPLAIVDYAHTPDALENVLATIDECNTGGRQTTGHIPERKPRVWCVFGCGGDRDRTKRPIMGRIAEEGADFVIVTDDNPRTEPSKDIFAEIREGFQSPTAAFWISDRAEAIETALSRAGASDIVVVAGKGHESYQVQGAKRIDFDDREVIRATWKRLRAQRKQNEN